MKGIIYKLQCIDNNNIFYIGSTINLPRRLRQHKHSCKSGKEYNYKLYKKIRENGNWENFNIEILEETEVAFRNELYEIEKNYIKNLDPKLNSYFYKN